MGSKLHTFPAAPGAPRNRGVFIPREDATPLGRERSGEPLRCRGGNLVGAASVPCCHGDEPHPPPGTGRSGGKLGEIPASPIEFRICENPFIAVVEPPCYSSFFL